MRLWQKTMIQLARSPSIGRMMQKRSAMSRFATRFVGGRDAAEAVRKSEELSSQGRRTSLYYLGEYVADASVIAATTSALKSAIDLLSTSGLDVHISVDPTQIGYQISEGLCRDRVFEIAESLRAAASHSPRTRSYLMLDMEDAGVTDWTLRLYDELQDARLPSAVTIQAYLKRAEGDLQRIVDRRGAVRLVKGAFAEDSDVAFTGRTEIDANYLKLAKMMLSAAARAGGFYPVFGTHDHRLIAMIVEHATRNGWSKDQYEFEMLYGVRVELQDKLVQEGGLLRLYLPFGTDWWAYAVRRVGEGPRNAKLLLRSLITRR